MKKNRESEPAAAAAGGEEEILERLASRVEQAVATIQELRRERDTLRARVEELESVQDDHDRYVRERGQIRERIEGILGSLEQLEE
jgi:FtsZ-binding cell division protein ZapB